MPETKIYFFKDADGSIPVKDWLRNLQQSDQKAFANCVAVIRMLSQYGFELHRPQTDYLRDGIYELRAKRGHVQYRILYFYCGKNITLLTHALVKKEKVPENDIVKAIERKMQFQQDPERYTAEE